MQLGVEVAAGRFDGFHLILFEVLYEFVVDERNALLYCFDVIGLFVGLDGAFEVVDYR